MTHRAARTLRYCLLVCLGFGGWSCGTPAWANPVRGPEERVVYLAGKMPRERLITLSSALAAAGRRDVLLLASPKVDVSHRLFLEAYRPDRVVPVGAFPQGVSELEHRLETRADPLLPWKQRPPLELWQRLFPRAARVVVCPAEPAPLLLQSACLAGVLRAPLYVLHGGRGEAAELHRLLRAWETKTIYAVGPVPKFGRSLAVGVVRLADAEAVAACHVRHLAKQGPIQTLVVANPADTNAELGGMSQLAPWVALQKRAALVLTNDSGDDVEEVVRRALDQKELRRADTLILVADLEAIPTEVRPNPIPNSKDAEIEMEPLTPKGHEPYSFAVGRLFHDDPGVVALVLARERLLELRRGQGHIRKALVASNSGDSLPLLETLSRHTARELSNRGYQTQALFGPQVNKDDLRRLLPEQDIFLWEGHHNTLIKEYGFADWDEPLRPSFVFLQSCLALKDYKAHPLLERGALGVVGSSTRIYAGSGGAFSLAFFNGLLYEDLTVGASLRQAKNFLLAYSLLKEKRLGAEAKLSMANLRSAWAFTLWGDPTLKLPQPGTPEEYLPPVRHRVQGSTIHIQVPGAAHEKAVTSKYQAEMRPNGRLAGLIYKEAVDDHRRLVPFLFAEVELPRAPAGKVPSLSSHLPSKRWVFCWDERRRCGYLLVLPRETDTEELRFHVRWEDKPVVVSR